MPKGKPSTVSAPLSPRTAAWLVACVAAASFPPAGAAPREPDGEFEIPARLHLSDALRLFRTQGLDLILAEAAVETARGDVLVAGAAPNPAVSASLGRSFACSGPGCSSLAWDVGLSDQSALFDSLSGKRGLRKNVAELAWQAARHGQADARRTLEALLRQSYLGTVALRQMLTTQKESRDTLAHLADLNRARYQHGSISEVEVLKVETEKLSADQEVERAARDLRAAEAALAFLLGARGRVPHFEVDEELPAYQVPRGLVDATTDSLLALARRHRPDLAAGEANRQRAGASIKASRRLRFPDVALAAGVSGQGSYTNAINPPTWSFGLTLTPPVWNRFEGEIVKAKADLVVQTTQLAKTEAQVLSDVQTAFSQFTSAKARVERAQRELLEHARRTRDLVRVQYEKGAASLLEYLDAQRTLIATQLDYQSDLADYWQSVALIEQAVATEVGP